MKKIIVLSVALCALVLSCKKDKNNNPGPSGPELIKFWAINIDSSQTLSVFDGFLDSAESLNPGEKTRVYEKPLGLYTLVRAQNSPADTTWIIYEADTPYKEVTMLLPNTSGNSHIVPVVSICSQPSAGNVLVRFVGFKGYNELKAVKNNNATIIHSGTWDGWKDRLISACNEIPAGTYDLVSTSSQQSLPAENLAGVNFKSGGVYFVYIGYNSKIRVIER